jgi:hypothetical protein
MRHLAHRVKTGKNVDGITTVNFRLLFAAMFLVSCASWQPLGFYELQSQRNFDRDLYECACEATVAGGENKPQVFDDCMKARGYQPT